VVVSVAGTGEVVYDPTRVARLSSRVPGTVWRVERQVGDSVRQGDLMALVDAAEVGKARTDFLQAFAQFDLKSRTVENLRRASSAVPLRSLQEAETALREARIRLLAAQQTLANLGLPVRHEGLSNLNEEQLVQAVQLLGLPDGLDPRTTSGNLLPLRAPMDGVVVQREVVAGEVVDTARVLFVVADPQTMSLDLNVRLEDARLLALGQTIHFRPDGQAPSGLPWYTVIGDRLSWNQARDGTLRWISTAVDEKTRTVKVRAAFENSDGRLRAGTFGTGRVVLRQEQAVVVPKEAVQWEGCCHVVFVQDRNYHAAGAPKVFHVRKVVPGAMDDTRTEIIAGVLPGEVVVTRGASVLRAELLKNDLGEG
jgi:cobalt-zinc-cadmium efflux system membrane fusion protein